MDKLFIIYSDKSVSINEIKECFTDALFSWSILSLNNIFGYDPKIFIIDNNLFEKTLKQIVFDNCRYITRDEKLFLKKLKTLNRKYEIGND